MSETHALIPEHPSTAGGGRLGRHIHFDSRSLGHRVTTSKALLWQSKTWDRTIAPFDQGQTGSCTGNGAAGLLASAPHYVTGEAISEDTARKIYSKATRLDTIQGSWPPADTGSTVLAAMKAMRALGYIHTYKWCLGLNDVLHTLGTTGPVEIGVSWYEGFDSPDANGLVRIAGEVRGGHAFELRGVDVANKLVRATNSWGPGWGLAGEFFITWADLERLLSENGEATTIVR